MSMMVGIRSHVFEVVSSDRSRNSKECNEYFDQIIALATKCANGEIGYNIFDHPRDDELDDYYSEVIKISEQFDAMPILVEEDVESMAECIKFDTVKA